MPPSLAASATSRLVIEPARGWSPLDVRELWRFRDLLVTLAGRDVKLRYKQTALGVGWIVLQPLLGAGILTFVFATIAKFKAPAGVPYFLLSFSGMVIWNSFNSALTRTSTAMIGNVNLVSKVYFPRIILPLSTLLSTVIDLAVNAIMLAIIMAAYRRAPAANVWLAPLFILLAMILAAGMGLFLSALAVRYRDVQHILPVLTQMLFFASPVAYSALRVTEHREKYFLNPLVSLIEGFRWCMIGVGDVKIAWVVYSAAAGVILFVAGAACFKRLERNFADVI